MITITKIGYNMPSGANWAYGIWLVTYNDMRDTNNRYFMSWTVKENFCGDSRFKSEGEFIVLSSVVSSDLSTGWNVGAFLSVDWALAQWSSFLSSEVQNNKRRSIKGIEENVRCRLCEVLPDITPSCPASSPWANGEVGGYFTKVLYKFIL